MINIPCGDLSDLTTGDEGRLDFVDCTDWIFIGIFTRAEQTFLARSRKLVIEGHGHRI
jgi:hypothetical protein